MLLKLASGPGPMSSARTPTGVGQLASTSARDHYHNHISILKQSYSSMVLRARGHMRDWPLMANDNFVILTLELSRLSFAIPPGTRV